jgi:hypothetical protein
MVVVAFTIPAHKEPIKTVGVLNMSDGPKLLTGSVDSTVKVVCCLNMLHLFY